MPERSPIYSAQAARRQIGYIEADKAFDLCGRSCAIYEGDSGLLRSPKHNAVVGYVSLANIFIGSSQMAEELFPPQENPEELYDQDFNSPVRSVEDGDVEDVPSVLPVAERPPLNQTVETDPPIARSVVSDPMLSERAGEEERSRHAANTTVSTAFPGPTSPELESFPGEQPALPPDASNVDKLSAPDGPGSDETALTRQPADIARPPIPLAVDAFMQNLAEYIDSDTHTTATPSSSTHSPVGCELCASTETKDALGEAPFRDRFSADDLSLVPAGDGLVPPAAETKVAKDEPVVENQSAVGELNAAVEGPIPSGELTTAQEQTASEERSAAEDELSDSSARPQPIPFVADQDGAMPVSYLHDHADFEKVLLDCSDDAGKVSESLGQSEFVPEPVRSTDDTPRHAVQDQAVQPSVLERSDGINQDSASIRIFFDAPTFVTDEASTFNNSHGDTSGPAPLSGPERVEAEEVEAKRVEAEEVEVERVEVERVEAERVEAEPTVESLLVKIARAYQMARGKYGEENSGAIAAAETSATKETFSANMDRILRAVLGELQKNGR